MTNFRLLFLVSNPYDIRHRFNVLILKFGFVRFMHVPRKIYVRRVNKLANTEIDVIYVAIYSD